MAASSERSHPSRHSLRSFLRMRSEDAPLRWSRACPARTGGGWCASKSSLIVGPIYSRKGAAGQEVSAFMERSRVGGVSNHGRKLGAKPSFETLAALVPQDEVRGCAPPVVASVPCTNRRRVVRIEVLPYRWTDLLTERRSGTRGLRLYGEEPRRRRLEPWPQARSEAILRDTRCARSSG